MGESKVYVKAGGKKYRIVGTARELVDADGLTSTLVVAHNNQLVGRFDLREVEWWLCGEEEDEE
jgi:hypothetical protein